MKKTFANIRTLAALLIASATLTACSNDDGIVDNAQPAQRQAPQVYTLTLQAGKADNAQTRALALDGTKLVAKWVAGEEVTVKRGDDELGTLSVKEGSVSADGQTCTFTGTLTGNIATDDMLTLTYHPVASLAAYASQTGTLESAAACDMATASVTVTDVDNGTNTITAGTATFATQTAMLKITMQDTGGNKINATKLQVKVDFGSSAGTRTLVSISPTGATYTANGDGILYFALPNATNAKSMLPGTAYQAAFDAATVSFTVTNGDESYTIDTEKKYTFAAGTYYATTLTKPLTYPVVLSEVTSAYVGSVVCSDGNVYAKVSDATTAGTTAVAMIAYVGSSTDHATYTRGLAIALADESESNWNTAKSTCEGKSAVTNAAWQLPSQNQWKAMFKAFGDNDASYSGLNTAITTAGGTALQESENNYYWSSTPLDEDDSYAWYVHLSEGGANWDYNIKENFFRVRACLAF